MNTPLCWAESYRDCVDELCEQALQHDWHLEQRSLTNQERYPTHFVRLGPRKPRKLLLITSGLHGVEGFLGSAIQSMVIRGFTSYLNEANGGAVLLVHAVNAFGFDQLRRVDANNVDLNRNFCLPNDDYCGAPSLYYQLDRFLNPKQWPQREIPFVLQAGFKIARYGIKSLRQAIAEGQYEYPLGLFFGGSKPSETNLALQRWLLPEIQSATSTLHLDLHTGLGDSGELRFLVEHELTSEEWTLLNVLSKNRVRRSDSNDEYRPRGSFHRWLRSNSPTTSSVCMEFGTFSSIKVLEAMRAENAAYHWGDRDSKGFRREKQQLKEMFFPASTTWRERALHDARTVLDRTFDFWLNR